MTLPEKQTSPIVLIVAWLIVGVPAAWGVEQTVLKSLDLFRSQPPPATQPATQPANH